jgi:hypothetical protein
MSNIVQASYRVEVDASKVNALLAALNDKEAKKAIKSGIRKAALIIRKQAQTNLVSAIPATNTPGHRKDGQRFKPLKNEISLSVYRNASGACVNIMNHGKKGSRAFLLRIFENGMVERKLEGRKRATNKGAKRGIIKPTYFFKNAVDSKKSEAENSLERNILDSIQKVIDKKK